MTHTRFWKKIPAWVWFNALFTLLSVGLYVIMAVQKQGIGFPLDDAWIHQTYARNLADYGEWAFIPGEPSAGSTSPLWTVLLTPLHLLSRDVPYLLTIFLGALCLWGISCFGELILRRNVPINSPIPVAGLFIAVEWHLVWAASSGMETSLMALVIMAFFYFLRQDDIKGKVLAGLIVGVGVWVRPDALTLIGPLLFCIVLLISGWKNRLKTAAMSGLALLVPLTIYLIINDALAGQIWPNTFYAKQAEYASMTNELMILRFGRLAALPLIGAGILLLPGFLIKMIESIRRWDWLWISTIIWWLGYTLIYALRLPVTYQHGRYLIPAMPVFFLIGLVGFVEWCQKGTLRAGIRWVLQKGWSYSLVTVSLVFLIMGAHSYSQDVAIINTEMVAAADWLRDNTDPDDLIAVHDIGAVGYFSQRSILDLAGLVTPQVVPIIRDEIRLAELLDAKEAAYLVTFPGWYSHLPSGKEVVFTTGGQFSPDAGGENMTIYRWKQE